jgi:hypothetical protein
MRPTREAAQRRQAVNIFYRAFGPVKDETVALGCAIKPARDLAKGVSGVP